MSEVEQPAGDSVVETAPETEVQADETFDEVESGEELETQEADPDPDIDDEIEGVKLRGKKEALERIKAERLMQADYTRKTQEVAEQRRTFEAQQQQLREHAQNFQTHQREVAQLVNVDERLAQFSQVNWQALTDQDPHQALKLHTEFTQLQAHRGQLVNALTQRQQEAKAQAQRETAKQLSEAQAVVQREIKGWSPELANKLVDYGKSQGFPMEVLKNVTKPEFVKTLHKAYLFDQLQAKRAKEQAKPADPVTRVSGVSAPVTKDPGRMSDAEFAAWRRRQIAQRR